MLHCPSHVAPPQAPADSYSNQTANALNGGHRPVPSFGARQGHPIPSLDQVPQANPAPNGYVQNHLNLPRHVGVLPPQQHSSQPLLPNGVAPASGMPLQHGKQPFQQNLFSGNAFNPSSFYGEESEEERDGEEEEEEPHAFQLSISQTQQDSSSTSRLSVNHAPQMHSNDSSASLVQAKASSGVSTLSTDQLLGIFNAGPSSNNQTSVNAIARKEDNSESRNGSDEFILPQGDDSSDDDYSTED
jgi:hypothetical protein